MGCVSLHPTKRQNATLSDFCRNCKPALSFFMSLQLMIVSTRKTSKTKRLKNAAVGCMRNTFRSQRKSLFFSVPYFLSMVFPVGSCRFREKLRYNFLVTGKIVFLGSKPTIMIGNDQTVLRISTCLNQIRRLEEGRLQSILRTISLFKGPLLGG